MYDVIIIGSGPAGLTAAIYAGRAMLSALVCEKDYMGTGQISVTDRYARSTADKSQRDTYGRNCKGLF